MIIVWSPDADAWRRPAGHQALAGDGADAAAVPAAHGERRPGGRAPHGSGPVRPLPCPLPASHTAIAPSAAHDASRPQHGLHAMPLTPACAGRQQLPRRLPPDGHGPVRRARSEPATARAPRPSGGKGVQT